MARFFFFAFAFAEQIKAIESKDTHLPTHPHTHAHTHNRSTLTMTDSASIAEPIEVPTPIYEPNHEPLEELATRNSEVRQTDSNEPYETEKGKVEKPAQVGGIALIVIALGLQVMAFVLTVIATPLDVFRNKHPRSYIPDSKQRACYSMWGYKRCGPRRSISSFSVSGSTVPLPMSGYICAAYRSRLRASAAFSVVGIFFALLTIVFIVLAMCKVMKTFVPALLALLSMVFLLVCWACMSGTYHKSCVWSHRGPGLIIVSKKEKMQDEYNYGAGFAIMVAAWGLELITSIMLFFA